MMAKYYIILLMTLISFGAIQIANAETLEFGIRLVPTKIIESTESKIEIFTLKDGKLFPQPIKDCTITSQNPDLLEILRKDSPNGYNVSVLIDAKKPGDAKISVAANGYKSKEFTVTIHQNNRNEKNILLKAIPDTFTINGPRTGFISVELLDEDGNPIVAKQDIDIRFSTSNDNSIELDQDEFTIKKGSYYKVQRFEVKSFDNPITIYAKTQDMPVVEKRIDVEEPDKPFHIILHVTPSKSTKNSIGNSFAIVQLVDDEDSPVLATRDIPITLKVNSEFENGLTLTKRGTVPQISFSGDLIIREGTYWGSVKIITNAGIEGEYEIGISARGFDVGESQTLELVENNQIEDPNIVFDPLPILMVGGIQLVGIAHLEDDDGLVQLADNNLDFTIFGSDPVFSSIPSNIEKLHTAGAVFAKLGYSKPDSLTIHENFENNILEDPEMFGPTENSLQLRSEPLIDKIKSNTVFPIVSYVVDNDGNTWYYPNDDEIFVSPSEIVTGSSQIVHAGSEPMLMEMFSKDEGSETLLVQTGKLTANLKVNTHNILTSKLDLDVPDRIFSEVTSQIIFQILDSQGDPIFASTDIIIDAISNDESILQIDEQLKIKRGESFSIVDITPKDVGTVELALLATGFPLTTETLTIDDLKPVIKFQGEDIVDANSIVDTSIIVTFDGLPMSGIPVSWNVINAIPQGEDEKTGSDGIAKIILKSETEPIKINAKVTSDFLPSSSALKTLKVNKTGIIDESIDNSLDILGEDSLLVIIPIVAASIGVVLYKKNLIKIKK
jgi:hypothetical protein